MVVPFSVILYKWLGEDSDILFRWCLSYLMITHKCCLLCKMLELHTVTNRSWVFSSVLFNLWSSLICDNGWFTESLLLKIPNCFFFIRRELFTVYQLLKQVCIYWSGQGDLESCSPMIFADSTMLAPCVRYMAQEKRYASIFLSTS